MIGSDWPVATLQTSFGHWVDVVTEVISGVSEDDRRAVLGGTAVTTYRLDVPYLPALGSSDARGARTSVMRPFRIEDRPAEEPAPGEVRLEVAYVGICGTDLHIKHGAMDARVKHPGRHRPRDVGHGRGRRRRRERLRGRATVSR